VRRASLLALAALLILAATPAGAQVPDVVARHAPLVWLHSGEKLWPVDATSFVEESALIWNRRKGCPDTNVAARGAIVQAKLGVYARPAGGAYRQRPTEARSKQPRGGGCRLQDEVRLATDYTRPESEHAEGFVLNLANDARFGTRYRCPVTQLRCGVYDRAPAYYQYRPGRFITYWFFFAYSAPVGGPGEIGFAAGHEGDWERIAVRLDRSDRPLEVAYWQHGDDPSRGNAQILEWSKLVGEGLVSSGHPVVYSARYSHASYPRACPEPRSGKRCPILDRRDRGWLWTTEPLLLDVTDQPWYGFGGAWGQIRTLGGRPLNGPSGPGPNGLRCHKPAAPRAWLTPRTCG
jgi:hypothetical protein